MSKNIIGEKLEEVREFLYLGRKISWRLKNEKEIKHKIAHTKMELNSKYILKFSSINLENQKKDILVYHHVRM